MSIPSIPKNLPALVKERFSSARASGALHFWPTQCALVTVNGLGVRFSQAIANKPKINKSDTDANKKPFDPFLEPPSDLLITELPPSHILVLNKFAIVPEHFILATKEFKEQDHYLEIEDVGTAYACITTWRQNGQDLFAFFNSGEHSGASQPHRHIQFLPVKSITDDMEDKSWWPLADELAAASKPKIPFRCFAAKIPENPTPLQLHQQYLELHRQATAATREHISVNPGDAFMHAETDKTSPISYNLAMTENSMVLSPRRAEGKFISRDPPEESFGPVSLNGTVLAGTLLVKNEREWIGLRQNNAQLAEVLESIGLPSSASKI